MSEPKISTILAEVGVRFAADQAHTSVGIYRAGAEKLSERLGVSSIELGATDMGVTWVGRGATIPVGQSTVLLEEIIGNARTLTVKANCQDSGLLLDVLQTVHIACFAVYTDLRKTKGSIEPVTLMGDVVHHTTVVAQFDRPFTKLLPFGNLLREKVETRMKERSWRLTAPPQHRFSVELRFMVGNRAVQGRITFEPRVDTKPSDGIFFTESPLPVEQHLQVLTELAKLD